MMEHRLQWISPAPPLRTGIANYSQDLFTAVDGIWPIDAALESGSVLGRFSTIRQIRPRDLQPDVPTIVHLGNSEFHDLAFQVASEVPAVIVLHDVFLHHARAALAVRSGDTRSYWRELQDLYGSPGVAAGRELFAGREPADLAQFPLCEPFVRAARATVVHNRAAAEEVAALVPGARVHIVPMGIPLPAVFPRAEARASLGLPDTAFVVASITHVNPNKRIPVVLRALRRLINYVPNAVLVLAGTGSDGALLTREIEILGLRSHVRQYGYVDDQTARALASAADACVNLRYPTTGETSASLLRLLGAGRPVLISDAGSSSELPAGVGLRIPVDAHEVEMVAAVLRSLAKCSELREDAGLAAQDFVRGHHSMMNMVDGYRAVLDEVYGLQLPRIDRMPVEEMPAPPSGVTAPAATHPSYALAASTIAELGLAGEPVAYETAGAAIVELGLDRGTTAPPGLPSERLRDRVECPLCGGDMDAVWRCRGCGVRLEMMGRVLDLHCHNEGK